jgi:hypothetical protein
MTRGHGSGVYQYGWGWFQRCLRAAAAAEEMAAKLRRLERAGRMVDIRVAINGDKELFGRHFDALTRE